MANPTQEAAYTPSTLFQASDLLSDLQEAWQAYYNADKGEASREAWIKYRRIRAKVALLVKKGLETQ